jgi:hypothetical protein
MKEIRKMLNSFQHSNSSKMSAYDKVTTDLLLLHFAHEELLSELKVLSD